MLDELGGWFHGLRYIKTIAMVPWHLLQMVRIVIWWVFGGMK